MAILRLGELVAGIRGTIGGTIYSANKSGPYARRWSKGSNPMTIGQTVQRARMTSHATYWQALSQAQRDAWDDYAADPAQELTNSLGEAYYATGYNWFVRINNHRFSTAEARITTAPDQARPAIPTINYIHVHTPIETDYDVLISYPSLQFDGYMCIAYLAFAPSFAKVWVSRGYRLVYAAKGGYTTQERLGDETLAIFGDPLLNSKAFMTIARQGTQGQRSTAATATCKVLTS